MSTHIGMVNDARPLVKPDSQLEVAVGEAVELELVSKDGSVRCFWLDAAGVERLIDLLQTANCIAADCRR